MSFSFGNTAPANGSKPSGSTFSFGGDASKSGTSGFSFGATAPAESKPASTGFSFGSTPAAAVPAPAAAATPTTSSFSFSGAPAPAPAPAAAPASTGFSFGGASSTPAAPAAAPASTGFSFGGAASTPAAPAAAPASTGFSFGGAASTPGAPAAAPASTGFSFGGAASTPAAPAAAPASTGFSFGGAASTPAAPAAAPASTGFSFGGAASTPSATTTPAAITTTALVTTDADNKQPDQEQPPAKYMNKTIESIINMWSEELERHATAFTNEAVKVSNWDNELMENQQTIGHLANDVRKLQVVNKELDANLNTISSYQQELRTSLEQLEDDVDKMYETQTQLPEAADIEREQTFQMAIDIDNQLNSMNKTLKDTVEQLNASFFSQTDEKNPMTQIIKILNVHQNTLQSIEQKTSGLNREITDIQDTLRKL